MAEAATYERTEIKGKVESVTRKTNANNREFSTVIIDGQECTAWDEGVRQMADMCKDGTVEAKLHRKVGSKYWTVGEITPIDVPTTPDAAAAVSEESADPSIAVRLECAKMAVDAHMGHDNRSNSGVIVAFATAIEMYVLGVDKKD